MLLWDKVVLFAEEKGTFSRYRKNVPLGGESQ